MQSGLHSDSSYEERPSLGTSVEAVLAGWRHACEHYTAEGVHVRALLAMDEDRREFCWREGVIHRLFPTGESRPATPSEQEMIRRFIQHGWFLVYRLEVRQEPVVLHNVGIKVQALQEEPAPARDAPHQEAIQDEANHDGQGENSDRASQPLEAAPHTPTSSALYRMNRLRGARFPTLLLLAGVVAGSGALAWIITHKITVGVGAAALMLVLALFVLWRTRRS